MAANSTQRNWGGARPNTGGARPGAGRPGMDGQRVTLKLPDDVAEAVKRDRNRYRDILIRSVRGAAKV